MLSGTYKLYGLINYLSRGDGMVGRGKLPPTSCEGLESFFLFNNFFFNWRLKFNKLKISYSISKKS